MVGGIGESPKVAGMSCGGVHGIPGPYNSPDIPGPTFAPVVLSTPTKVRPEDIDALLVKAGSNLVGGVVQPVSILYTPGIPAPTAYINPSFVTDGGTLRGGGECCWFLPLSEALGFPALLDGE